MKKRFIIRKYVMASSAKEAIKKEKKLTADEVWLDEKWIELHDKQDTQKLGF